MSQQTSLAKIPYPDEDKDPYYEDFQGMVDYLDAMGFGFYNTLSNIIIPASGIVWNASMGQISWADYFEIPLMNVGYSVKVQFAPNGSDKFVNMIDGDRLYADIPNTSAQNLDINFKIANGNLPFFPGRMTFGFRRGNKFYANWAQVYT